MSDIKTRQQEKSNESAIDLKYAENCKGPDKVSSYKIPLESSVFNRPELGRCSTRSDDSLDSGVSLR